MFRSIQYFINKGFAKNPNDSFEEGFLKIALYADGNNFCHVARQLLDGKWTSKLGEWEDIEHNSLHDLCGDFFGKDIIVLAKKI